MIAILDDDPPEGEPPPRLLMSDFAAQMLSADTRGSPLWLAEAVTLLLETGRPGPALTLLRELPAAIRGTAEAIYAEGREMGRRAAQRAAEKDAALSGPVAPASAPEAPQRPAIPAYARQAVELAGHIARLGADRVATVLGVRLVDLQPMLEGRVQPPKTGMRRLRATAQDPER